LRFKVEKDSSVDLAKFAGSIKPGGFGFLHITKVTIAISVLFALLMLTLK
jgi:hypothetical protein